MALRMIIIKTPIPNTMTRAIAKLIQAAATGLACGGNRAFRVVIMVALKTNAKYSPNPPIRTAIRTDHTLARFISFTVTIVFT
jgi:hypothetical protein